MKRTKLDFEDFKFIVYLFFASITNFCLLNFNKSKFQWMLMQLTASGRFENIDRSEQGD